MTNDRRNDRPDDNSLIDITFIVDDMWKEFLKLWWLMLIIVSISSSIVFFYVKMTWTPKYVASSTYTVDANAGYDYNSSYYNKTQATDLGATLQYVLSSTSMKQIVARDLGISKVPGKISVENQEGTNLITISVSSPNPEVSYAVLQSVIRNYPSVAEYVIGNTVLEVLDETGVPTAPSNPQNAKREAVKGFLAGAVIDVCLLFLLAITKHTIKKEEDLKKVLNVDCYGAIPRARFKKRGKKSGPEAEKVMIDNSRIPGGFREAIRSIRSKIVQEAVRHDYHVLLVSSSIAGEGKSTVAANLALALSRKGKSVILADMDLRSPAVADRLYLPECEKGTIDVLKGNSTLKDTLLPYNNSNMKILPGGEPTVQPKKILSQPAVKEMIRELRTMADYIILDTPPCAMLSDTMNIAKYADAALFVVRQDYARIEDIMEGIRNLHDAELPICGCVLNNAEVGITGYGYSQNYGYGRYGYGYGNKKYGYGYGGYGYGQEEDKKKDE